MIFGHKTQARTISTDQATFDRMVSDGAIVAADWMECPPVPVYDPATQAAPYWASGAWQVRALNAEEIAVRAATAQEANDLESERAQIAAVLNDLKNGTGTTAQRLTRCERAIVFLFKRLIQ
jgi:hypothetical protein